MTALTDCEYRLPAQAGPRPGHEKGLERRDNLNRRAWSAKRNPPVKHQRRSVRPFRESNKAMRSMWERFRKFTASAQLVASSLSTGAVSAGAGASVCQRSKRSCAAAPRRRAGPDLAAGRAGSQNRSNRWGCRGNWNHKTKNISLYSRLQYNTQASCARRSCRVLDFLFYFMALHLRFRCIAQNCHYILLIS